MMIMMDHVDNDDNDETGDTDLNQYKMEVYSLESSSKEKHFTVSAALLIFTLGLHFEMWRIIRLSF